MEVRINKEVRNYQESLFFGLSLRQFLFALLAVLVALAVYFFLHPVLGTGEILSLIHISEPTRPY